jgi:hypothetical protein
MDWLGWGEWRVGFFFFCALPMHVWWFSNAVKGLRKKMRSRRRESEAWRLLLKEKADREIIERGRKIQEEAKQVRVEQVTNSGESSRRNSIEKIEIEESIVEPPPPPYQCYDAQMEQRLSSISNLSIGGQSFHVRRKFSRRALSPSPSPFIPIAGRFPSPVPEDPTAYRRHVCVSRISHIR